MTQHRPHSAPLPLCVMTIPLILHTLDVTIPDGAPVTPGQEFVKTWKIKNTGICTWDEGYQAHLFL